MALRGPSAIKSLKKPGSSSGKPIRIALVGDGYVKRRANHFKAAIRKSFGDAKYLEDGRTANDIIRSSLTGCGRKHIVALDKRNNVKGFIFHVPTNNLDAWQSGTWVGWFGVNMPKGQRREIADKMFETMNKTMKKAGYKRIVASVGTKRGLDYLLSHGYYLDGVDEHGRALENTVAKNL